MMSSAACTSPPESEARVDTRRLAGVDAERLRSAMGQFATGVTVVTSRDIAGRPLGTTANAVWARSGRRRGGAPDGPDRLLHRHRRPWTDRRHSGGGSPCLTDRRSHGRRVRRRAQAARSVPRRFIGRQRDRRRRHGSVGGDEVSGAPAVGLEVSDEGGVRRVRLTAEAMAAACAGRRSSTPPARQRPE
jgi:hypothetical protein